MSPSGTNRYIVISAKRNKWLCKPFESTRMDAEQHGWRLAETREEIVDIYEWVDEQWVWINKAYPNRPLQ